ncbi:MAG: uroporphyrinogen-III C-methyltransferase [Bacteroidetes bacterium]|nr:uroporphyrinogen-III C-methyltransferase [Bacteroidota bacterium]
MSSIPSSKGFVVLAGAGPGDPELITLKLQRRLREADVIIADRLVHPDIIQFNASADTHVILAGKQGYNDASFTQEEITKLIISYALEGKKVLRLKGGDVAFFSNVLDELIGLTENQIPFEIIPGITAASGASAYASIPLTARGYAQGVRFLTFNPNTVYTENTWNEIAHTDDTLVCYMASKNLTHVVEKLLHQGAFVDTLIAIIEQATTAQQKVSVTTLAKFNQQFPDPAFASPSLVIIGSVIALHEKFNWFNTGEEGAAFQELA